MIFYPSPPPKKGITFFSLFEERFETCSSLDLEISLVLAKFTFEIFPGGEEGQTEGGGRLADLRQSKEGRKEEAAAGSFFLERGQPSIIEMKGIAVAFATIAKGSTGGY